MSAIYLISVDNHKIEIDSKAAMKSSVLKEEMSKSNKKNIEYKLKEVKYEILKKIVEYLNYYRNKTPREIPKPTPSENMSAFLEEWDFNYITNVDLDTTFDLMNGANELGIQSLLDLASTKIAWIFKNKDVDELRGMFSTGCDLTPKELKEYQELQL